MLIKMVATNYLPTMEIGRRRRQLRDDQTPLTDEDIERRRRDRRKSRLPNMGPEVDEDMHAPLQPGEVVS
jgi:dynactin-4